MRFGSPRRGRIALLLLALGAAAPVVAQPARIDRIEIAESDSAILRGTVRGREVVEYHVAAAAGQRVQAELTSTNADAFMNVRAPGETQTIHAGPVRGNLFDGEAPVAGDYRLMVFLTAEAARREDAAEYVLSVTLGPRPSAPPAPPPVAAPVPMPPRPEPAAAPAAAPEAPPQEAWIVTGLPRGQQLNLRAGPSTRDRVIGRVAQREALRGRGCREVEEERWCEVERANGTAGWVAARYLAEAQAPARPASPARAPGTFDATGMLPCAMVRGQTSRDCRFGVERGGAGAAVVEVLGSNNVTRRITFERGVPVRSDGPGELTFERFGDLFLIRAGDERFEVPEAVVTGG